jgi:hypothetical protein
MKIKDILGIFLIICVIVIIGCDESNNNGDLPTMSPHRLGPYEVGVKTMVLYDTSRPFDVLTLEFGTWDNIFEPSLKQDPEGAQILNDVKVELGIGIDGSIDEFVSDPTKTTRTLVLDIYYPVDRSEIDENSDRYTFNDYMQNSPGGLKWWEENVQGITLELPYIIDLVDPTKVNTIEVLNDAVEQNFDSYLFAFIDEPVSSKKSPFPVIIYNPGDRVIRGLDTDYMAGLASAGYIVVLIERQELVEFATAEIVDDHFASVNPGMSIIYEKLGPITYELAYGRTAPNSTYPFTWDYNSANAGLLPILGGQEPIREETVQFLTSVDTFLQEARKDIHFVLGELDIMSRSPGSMFYGKVNIDRVGLSGLSSGAVAAYILGENMEEIDASVAVVGEGYPDVRGIFRDEELGGNESLILNKQSPPAHLMSTKPVMYLQTPVDGRQFWADFALGISTEKTELPSAEHPLLYFEQFFENAKGPVVLTSLEGGDHLDPLSIQDTWAPGLGLDDIVVPWEQDWQRLVAELFDGTLFTRSDQENIRIFQCIDQDLGVCTKTKFGRIDNRLGNNIVNRSALVFFDAYLKDNRSSLIKLKEERLFRSFGQDVQSKNIKVSGD